MFGRRSGVPRAADSDVQARIKALEDDVAALERRFESLRSSVTGGLRRMRRQRELEEQLEVDDAMDEPSELDFDHSLGAARRFKREA